LSAVTRIQTVITNDQRDQIMSTIQIKRETENQIKFFRKIATKIVHVLANIFAFLIVLQFSQNSKLLHMIHLA